VREAKLFVRDNLPEKPIGANLHKDFSVDTMLLHVNGHAVTCLSVDGLEARFDSTGHFPILAGYDTYGQQLYVAAIRRGLLWHFTRIKEGVSTATYADEIGKTQTTPKFFVLALRYDPCSFMSPYPRAHKGAMDPTGPLFWLKFWPEKEPDYYDDDRLADDRILETLLNRISARPNSDWLV